MLITRRLYPEAEALSADDWREEAAVTTPHNPKATAREEVTSARVGEVIPTRG